MPGFEADKAKRLSGINIANGNFCKKFVLSQDTFVDNTIYKSNQYTDYRLRLKTIQESDCKTANQLTVPPFEFTYYNNGDINFLPNRLSSAIDHRGGSVLQYKTYTGDTYSYLDFYPYKSFSINRDSTFKPIVTVDDYEKGLPKQMTHISSTVPQIFTWDIYKRLTTKNFGTFNWGCRLLWHIQFGEICF